MAYNPITSTEIQVKQPVRQELMQKVKDNFDYLYGLAGDTYGNIFNGSFEIDSDNDGIPDGWTRDLYPSGTAGYETTSPAHGAKAYKFTHPGGAGNGGGYLESDYCAADSLVTRVFSFIMWASVASNLKVMADVLYYDKAKVYLSTTNLLTTTTPPTTATVYRYQFTPPANARYCKFRLIGGYTDTNPGSAQSVYFDGGELDRQFLCNTVHGEVGEFSTASTSLQNIWSRYLFIPHNAKRLVLRAQFKIGGAPFSWSCALRIDGIDGPVQGGTNTSYKLFDVVSDVSQWRGQYKQFDVMLKTSYATANAFINLPNATYENALYFTNLDN
jgi:hypothetical protein